MSVNLDQNYPSTRNCEVIYQWGETNALVIEKCIYETGESYDFCICNKAYHNFVSILFDVEMNFFREPPKNVIVRDFSLEDLNTVAKAMGTEQTDNSESTAKNIVMEIEKVCEKLLNKKPCSSFFR